MKSDSDETTQSAEYVNASEMSEEEIDSTLEDSFPASDPPGWTLGSDHYSETTVEDESGDREDKPS